ncbi:hypothetical protein DVA67_032510 [Solirubrobacter sp. CPCC 204708]|uniref:Glycosyl hydrolase n=1 Tax=Solirubrobacter deserti TaxID=2282478 RepID=A0ABT4RQU3_9ACTN|nr:glycosyl hydrolase [Solirubrobacter deserti]MBE2320727.1 hypothetical protein [Solirubrobacter deserti]MDA0140951.1 glycosyl hydrolase [Solirubrobacter deserti]
MSRRRDPMIRALAGGLLAAALVVPVAVGAPGAAAPTPFEAELEALYDTIETDYRPGVRWWLAEGLNTDETLRKNVKEIADSGFGAAEFLAMPEPGADDKLYGWGSQEWNADSQLVVQEAVKRGLGFSLTSGTHWATANLPDTYTWEGAKFDYDNKAASKELNYSTVLLAAGDAFNDKLPAPVKPTQSAASKELLFQGVVAAKITQARPQSGQANGFREGTGTGQIDFDTLVDLTDRAVPDGDGYRLNWTAPADGQYGLFTYWMHGTGETFDPSTSENYTINYMDRFGVDAVKDYWEEHVLTPELREQIQQSGKGEIYMDSLELASFAAGGLLWGYQFKQEFRQRRGYDVTPYLPLITWDRTRHDSNRPPVFDYAVADPADQAQLQKIRNDINQTYSELYEQNVLKPMQEWLHSLNMKLRAEPSYGFVFEISTPAKYIDGVETETFAHNGDLDTYRGMLGSAHMYNRPFSSETGAVGGRNYYYDMDYWTQLSYLQFAGGVNRIVFHGYSGIEGSEPDTYWPGHEGMYVTFSDRFNSRQPAAVSYPRWTEMLGRNQKVLRQGQPRRDIAILRTDNAFISYGHPRDNRPAENSLFMNDMPYFWRDLGLQHAGYTYDYFSPQLLEDEANVSWTGEELQPDGPGYKAMIVYQDSLELSAARKLLEIARDGLPLLFVNNTSEIRVHDGSIVEHGTAAGKSRFTADSDADLAAVVAQLKALPNVKTVDKQADAKATLEALDVKPRVSYAQPSNQVMTISRYDKARNVLYTFVHSFKFEKNRGQAASTVTLALEGAGKPYTLDDWTGDVSPVGAYAVQGGRTSVDVTLKPGEAQIIALDLDAAEDKVHAVSTTADEALIDGANTSIRATRSGAYQTQLNDGRTVTTNVEVPGEIALPKWDITIEDWNEGEKVVNTEEKFGHTTREVYFTTKKTPLVFEDSPLLAWKDLPATPAQLATLTGTDPKMSDVSGIGTYRTTFTLPAGWNATNGAYFTVPSTGDGNTQVTANGKRTEADLDLRTLKLDISDLLKPGENTIEVTVETTLTNRLLTRGYRTAGPAQSYGLQGEAKIVPYTVAGVYAQTTGTGTVGGSVPATLSLSLGTVKPFDPFTPGVEKEYTASTTATVISTAGDAKLTVSEPGHMTNGAFSLAEPLRVELSKAAWTAPVSNDVVDVAFKQRIKRTDPLRTGTYSKTLTFTLSTTNP